jgi:PAS domain S-box-containing protein
LPVTDIPLPFPTGPSLAERWGFDPESERDTFSRIARLAQAIAGTSMARVFLQDGSKPWSAGSVITGPLKGPNHFALIDLVGDPGERRWVEDARHDARLRDNPMVAGKPYIRFLACAPIVMSDGEAIGGLYVADTAARAPDAQIAASLCDLAELVAQACERPRLRKDLAEAAAEATATAQVLSDFVECCPVALSMIDRDLRYLRVSPRWRIETGLENADVIGKTVQEIFPDTFEHRRETYGRALAGETIRSDRTRLLLPNGQRPWVRTALTPWRGADGQIGGLLSMTYEITDMVEALERSKRSERRLKLAAEISGVNVYEVDYVNQTVITEGDFDAFFEREMTFQDFCDDPSCAVHPDDVERVAKIWNDCQAAGQPFRAEYRVRPVNGREVWVFSGAERVTGADGRPKTMTGVLQNITPRKEAERALTQARDSADDANRAKSEFLANMSHEIRTPLNGVMGVAGALARTELNEAQHDMVRLIETSAQTLESLLSDVLDLARIESGRLALNIAPFSIEDAVQPVAALFEPNARRKGLDFRVDLAEEAKGLFAGDVARIRQILSNLISNAVKFTAKGAVRVTVTVKSSDQNASLIHFSVADSGIGFDAETEKRLFGRFEQADGSITRRFGGTGLGLAISRSLAEEMGGQLGATATPGQGACFTFTIELPRRGDLQPARPAAAAAALEETPTAMDFTPRVLLAEDHPTNRRVVELILGSISVNLTSVANGQEALDAFASQAFDLILMDMQMPVMDGLTAIEAIREQEKLEGRPRTPIYALTANAMPEHVEASRRAGADAHLTKPITATDLIAAVGRLARAARPELDRRLA